MTSTMETKKKAHCDKHKTTAAESHFSLFNEHLSHHTERKSSLNTTDANTDQKSQDVTFSCLMLTYGAESETYLENSQKQ